MLAVFALLGPATARAAEGGDWNKVELRYRLQKGETYTLRMTAKQDVVQWVMGNEMEIAQTFSFAMTYKVNDVDEEDVAEIEVTFSSVKFKMEQQMMTLEFDSDDPPDEIPEPLKAFAAMVGQSLKVKMKPTGAVVAVEGIEEMMENVLDAVDLPNDAAKEQAMQMFDQFFGEDSLTSMLEGMTRIYPDDPVAAGESWTTQMDAKIGFPMRLKNTYKLKERKDNVATLEMVTTIEPDEDAEPMTIGDIEMVFDLSGTQKGTMKVDELTGWPVGGTMDQEIEGEIKLKGVPGQDRMKIPMTIESRITFTTE
jgi:hypothetical protein